MTDTVQRDLNLESRDHRDHRYAYKFDYRMHHYMMRTFASSMVEGNALELGCYRGHFTELLKRRFDDLEIVEGSDECITAARLAVGKGPIFHLAKFEEFQTTRQYANIFLIHTLEHLESPGTVLARIRSWLTPTGRLFVATPNARAASRQIAVAMGLVEHNSAVTPAEHAHGHRTTYSADTLEAEVRRGGLHVVERGGIFFKSLANFQLDQGLDLGVLQDAYFEGCFVLGSMYPDLCASIYCVCQRSSTGE